MSGLVSRSQRRLSCGFVPIEMRYYLAFTFANLAIHALAIFARAGRYTGWRLRHRYDFV